MSAQENPEAVAHFKKGDTFYRNGDHVEAIAEFDKAIELAAQGQQIAEKIF